MIILGLILSLPGSYAGFDDTAPTSQQDGKAQVCAYLKERFDYQTVIMVGDGATDMAACPPAVSIAPTSLWFARLAMS